MGWGGLSFLLPELNLPAKFVPDRFTLSVRSRAWEIMPIQELVFLNSVGPVI